MNESHLATHMELDLIRNTESGNDNIDQGRILFTNLLSRNIQQTDFCFLNNSETQNIKKHTFTN